MNVFFVFGLVFLVLVSSTASQSTDWLNIHVVAHTHDVRTFKRDEKCYSQAHIFFDYILGCWLVENSRSVFLWSE